VDSRLPELVLGDVNRLQQVLVNLGGNAVKFTERGQVVIALTLVNWSGSLIKVLFEVRDSGIGIAPEFLQRIFTSFSQAETSTTRRFGGTGLGLAISKSLVELMGGTLNLESTEGLGSSFAFEIEFCVEQNIPDGTSEQTALELQRQRALIIDDNMVANQLLHKMVQSIGWQGDCVSSGVEALELLSPIFSLNTVEFPYSLVIVNWQMPQMDGWETCREIRNIARCMGASPVIIMLSDNGRHDLSVRSDEDQSLVNGFLVKPVTMSMISNAVLNATSRSPNVRKLSAGRQRKRQLAGMRILVVEDNLINQQIAEELLGAEGAIVSMAANGQIGVEAVLKAAPQFDVVLMDIQMPVMDGYTATTAIRNEIDATRLPIVAMTANATASDREACIACGMDDHIGKPFDLDKLISLLIRITGITPDSNYPAALVDNEALQSVPLGQVEGVELKDALARMSGSRSLYTRTAKDFSRTLPAIHVALEEMLNAFDTKQLSMTLHTLKGNAATLGLSELAREARRLEQLSILNVNEAELRKALNGLTIYLDQAGKLLIQAVETVKEIVAASTTSCIPFVSSEQIVDALAALATLLEQSDMEALECFAARRVCLERLPGGLFEKLDVALQNLDFESGYQICIDAQEALQHPLQSHTQMSPSTAQ
jgi:CheY-like chemotaxis protein